MKHLWRVCAALLLGASLTVPQGCGSRGAGAQIAPENSPQVKALSFGDSPFAAAPDDFDINNTDKVASASFAKFFLDTVNQASGGRWTVANTSGKKAFTLTNIYESAPYAWVLGNNYWNRESDTLTSNDFTIPGDFAGNGNGTRGIRFSFFSRWSIASGDMATVEYRIDGGPWSVLAQASGGQSPNYPNWSKYYFELPDNDSGQDQTWNVRYTFASNTSGTDWGFGVDRVAVYQRRLAVPANVAATDLDDSIVRQIRISWDADSDPLLPDSYTILRSTSEQGPYALVATINDPSTTTSYLDTPPETVTQYWYKLVAHKAGWLDSVDSASTAGQAATTAVVNLGQAESFGGFGGGAGMTNQGTSTVVNGDISTTAASTTITGFHDADDVYTETPSNIGEVTGEIYTDLPFPGTSQQMAIATQAASDAQAAYDNLSPANLPGGSDPGAGELGGLTLSPGVYKAAGGTFQITGNDLTLDGGGDPNAVWVFQAESSLTVGDTAARSITLINGAQAKNVYWYVGSSATINGAGGGTMVGTILASAGVTFSTAGNAVITTLDGRALGLNASVTLVNTVINVPAP